jgi:hypothetical protein
MLLLHLQSTFHQSVYVPGMKHPVGQLKTMFLKATHGTMKPFRVSAMLSTMQNYAD